ncbi:MAG: SEL1-like repeat protein, partial [Saccharospirillaceae bacterium]|nr:SEL1-like repeat protein [Pseudomonadales bacterium]NRB81038.1 SEL1-like repeat protein [Saccharospirillaceae bacterium]
AQYNLAVMYSKGVGVEKDLILTYAWLNISAENGYKKGVEGVEFIMDLLSKKELIAALKLSNEISQKINSN